MEFCIFFWCFSWIILLGSSQEPHQKVEADAGDVELGQLGKDAISDGSSRDSCESRERLLTTRTANDWILVACLMGNLIVKDSPSKAGGPIEALFRRALQVFAPDFMVRKGRSWWKLLLSTLKLHRVSEINGYRLLRLRCSKKNHNRKCCSKLGESTISPLHGFFARCWEFLSKWFLWFAAFSRNDGRWEKGSFHMQKNTRLSTLNSILIAPEKKLKGTNRINLTLLFNTVKQT